MNKKKNIFTNFAIATFLTIANDNLSLIDYTIEVIDIVIEWLCFLKRSTVRVDKNTGIE